MIKVRDLCVLYKTKPAYAVQNVSFEIGKAEIVGIVGESGSGKSTIANAILQLLPHNTKIEGEIELLGEELNRNNILNYRGDYISFISQDFFLSLCDNFTIYKQFDYLLKSKSKEAKNARKKKMINLLKELNFRAPEEILRKYPFELSGGMKQRIVIAMALANEPKLLIADEPTSAIDTVSKKSMLGILKKLNKEKEISILLISHDLPIIKDFVDSLIVMYNGVIVEKGSSFNVYDNPNHPYTKMLLDSKPDYNKSKLSEKKIINSLNEKSQCKFYKYCNVCNGECTRQIKENEYNGHYCRCNRGFQ